MKTRTKWIIGIVAALAVVMVVDCTSRAEPPTATPEPTPTQAATSAPEPAPAPTSEPEMEATPIPVAAATEVVGQGYQREVEPCSNRDAFPSLYEGVPYEEVGDGMCAFYYSPPPATIESTPAPTPEPTPTPTSPFTSDAPTPEPTPIPFDAIDQQVQELLAYVPGTPAPGGVTEDPCTYEYESVDVIFTFTPLLREGEPTYMVWRVDDDAHHQVMYDEDRNIMGEVILIADLGSYFREMGDDGQWRPWEHDEFMTPPSPTPDVWSPLDTLTPSPTPTPEPEPTFCGPWPLSDVENLGQTRIGPDDTLVTHYLVQVDDYWYIEHFVDASGTTIMSRDSTMEDDGWFHAIAIFSGFGEPNVITAPNILE